jgi:hypothetical protein
MIILDFKPSKARAGGNVLLTVLRFFKYKKAISGIRTMEESCPYHDSYCSWESGL